MTTDKVLEDWFGDERTLHFNAPDIIHNEHYLRYRKTQGYIVIWIGDGGGEVPVQAFKIIKDDTPERLNAFIYFTVHGLIYAKKEGI